MRKSRTKMRKENKGVKYTVIILFIIILPLISILPGYFGSKYLIIPTLFSDIQKNDNSNSTPKNIVQNNDEPIEEVTPLEEDEDFTEYKSLELRGFDFFSYQVGNFSTRENADEFVKELKQKKMGSVIYEKDSFKVLTLSFLNRNHLDSLIPSIETSYEGFVVSTSIPTKTIQYNVEEAEYISRLQTENDKFITILDELSDYLFRVETNNITIKEYRSKLVVSKRRLEESLNMFNSVNYPSRFKVIHNEFIDLTNSTLESLNLAVSQSDEKIFVNGKNILNKSLFLYLNFNKNIV